MLRLDNLFGDTNAVHVTVDADGYSTEGWRCIGSDDIVTSVTLTIGQDAPPTRIESGVIFPLLPRDIGALLSSISSASPKLRGFRCLRLSALGHHPTTYTAAPVKPQSERRQPSLP